MFALHGSMPRHFCFVKFPVSPGLFPSGFIHDPHLEIIYVHKNRPSAILGKAVRVRVGSWIRLCARGPLGPPLQDGTGANGQEELRLRLRSKPKPPVLKTLLRWIRGLARL